MLNEILTKTKEAQRSLELLTSDQRNLCLSLISSALEKNKEQIIEANKLDIENAKANCLKDSMIERLTLDNKKLDGIIKGVKEVEALEDYNGKTIETICRPNGLLIEKIYVPIGVIGVIFESRPNVCVDIACLCLKTSNACVLKGGKEAINTNRCLVSIMQKAIEKVVLKEVITLIDSVDRKITDELITKKEYIDCLIPRGSKGLISYVTSNAKIPTIETGAGNCHLYIHEDADIEMALKIALNSKYQRPSVCNAIENILVDEKIKNEFLPKLKSLFTTYPVEIRGCEKTRKVIDAKVANKEDYDTEYNDYIVTVKVVKNIEEAIKHINTHSTKHSEAIVTENINARDKFFKEIDSACVYHNASTRFTDGGCFGFGAEIGISTQKLHARGPMGLRELFSYKYKIKGNGQVR